MARINVNFHISAYSIEEAADIANRLRGVSHEQGFGGSVPDEYEDKVNALLPAGPGVYSATEVANNTVEATTKRTRRTKEQIEADNLKAAQVSANAGSPQSASGATDQSSAPGSAQGSGAQTSGNGPTAQTSASPSNPMAVATDLKSQIDKVVAEEKAAEAGAPDIAAVKAVMASHMAKHDAKKTQGVLLEHGGAARVSEVDPSKYQAVINALSAEL